MFAPLPLAAALLLAPQSGPVPGGTDPPAPPDAPATVAGRTADDYAAALSDPNRVKRTRAALSLRAFGPAAAPHLAAALLNHDPAVRFWAAEGLGMFPAAAAALESDPDLQPKIVLRAMVHIGPTAERLAAAFALAALGEPDAGVPVLVDGLDHPSRGVAVTAADFLARLGEVASSAGPALKDKALNHDDYHVRYRSAQALAAATGEELKTSQVMK